MALKYVVDVVIPTFKNVSELKQCLDSLRQQSFRDFRVFICLDGNCDQTRAWLNGRTFEFSHCVLHHPYFAHKGRNATRNLILPHLDSDVLVFLDSDNRAHPDYIFEHVRFLWAFSETISVGHIHYEDADRNVWAAFSQRRGASSQADGTAIPPHYFKTGNAAMPTHLFQSVDGMEASMSGYGGGDTELAFRLKTQTGIHFRFNRKAVTISEMNKDLAKVLVQLEQFGGENLMYLSNKYPALAGELFDIKRIYGSVFLRFVFGLLRVGERVALLWIEFRLPGWFSLISALVAMRVSRGFVSSKV